MYEMSYVQDEDGYFTPIPYPAGVNQETVCAPIYTPKHKSIGYQTPIWYYGMNRVNCYVPCNMVLADNDYADVAVMNELLSCVENDNDEVIIIKPEKDEATQYSEDKGRFDKKNMLDKFFNVFMDLYKGGVLIVAENSEEYLAKETHGFKLKEYEIFNPEKTMATTTAIYSMMYPGEKVPTVKQFGAYLYDHKLLRQYKDAEGDRYKVKKTIGEKRVGVWWLVVSAIEAHMEKAA